MSTTNYKFCEILKLSTLLAAIYFATLFRAFCKPSEFRSKTFLNDIIFLKPEPKVKEKFKKGLKHGYQIYYHPEGWVEKKEKWQRGKLLYTIFYDKNHRKIKWVQANGVEKYYRNCGCSN